LERESALSHLGGEVPHLIVNNKATLGSLVAIGDVGLKSAYLIEKHRKIAIDMREIGILCTIFQSLSKNGLVLVVGQFE
jgi:hypothetical protein